MSKMFDNLRRAEAARKRKNGGREGNPATTDATEHAAPGPERPRGDVVASPSGNGAGKLPEGFTRELGILRNSLQSAAMEKPLRTVLFTSASHEEGVTTLASSYASLAALGSQERVLLVELNARRPSLFWRLGLEADTGVTHFFEEKRPLSSIVQRDPRFGFEVVHVGEKDPSKIQLHLEEELPRLLAEATAGYSTVVIDGPPVVLSPETPQIARRVDGVVMVVHCGKTRREIVQRSIDMIEQFEGSVLGVVLNRKKYYIPDFIYQRV